jgi:UPF0716 protein FxsA
MPVVIIVLLWPLLEIAGFAWIGGAIGVGPTLAFVLVSGLLGLALLRRAGLSTLMQLRASVEAGETPVPAALDGAWRILAGILLAVPGFFSSGVALLLLLPPVRALLTVLAARWVRTGGGGVWTVSTGPGLRSESGSTIIEGEFHELTPKPPELPPQR